MKKIWTTILVYILIIIFIDYNVAHSRIYVISNYDKLSYYYSWMNPTLYYHIRRNSIRYKVPEELICAVIQHESRGKIFAKSPVGARGVMQVMPVHAGKSHPKILYKVKVNVQLGTWYLSECLKKARHVKISKKDKVKQYQGIIKESCRMYNSGIARKRSVYKNWKYTERIYADYRNLTEKL